MSKSAALILASLLAGTAAAQGSESLLNGSFEDRPKGQPEIPSHWQIETSDSRVKMSPRRARTGRVSLSIDNQTPESRTVVGQDVSADVWREQLVRVSGWYRRQGVRRTPGHLTVRVVGEDGLLVESASGEQLGAASRWTLLEAVVFVSPNAETLEVRFTAEGAGDVWLDDLSLQTVQLDAGEPAPKVQRYLEDAVALVRRNALEAGERDWDEIFREAMTLASGAREYQDAYPALQYVLSRLGTAGSRLVPPSGSVADEEKALESPTARIERGKFGVLTAPPLERATIGAAQEYIDQGHAAVAQLEVQGVCGYVLDLRGTAGDDVIPMAGAFSALLGEGRVGGLVDSEGRSSFLRGVGGDIRNEDGVLARPTKATRAPQRPVAVVFNQETAGAGESLVVLFHGRPGVRFFGMDTAGRPTEFRRLALDDEAVIVVAATYPADRLGRVYTETIKPDVRVRPRLGRDRPLSRALDWLDDTEACQ